VRRARRARGGPAAALALGFALAAANADAQDAAPAAPTESAPPLPVPRFDFTTTFDHAAYEAALGRIAEAFPDWIRVRSLGKSGGGRDLWLAVVADPAAGDVRRLPATLILTDLGEGVSGAVAGPEAALFVLENLLARVRADPAERERFRGSAVYVLPAPDPDLAFRAGVDEGARAARRSTRLDENFPARWLPFGPAVASPGPHPLSEPESRTLARFLLERSNLSTMVLVSRRPVLAPVASSPEEDGPAAAVPSAHPPGSLRAFGRDVLDLAVLDAHPWEGAATETEFGLAPGGFATTLEHVETAVEALPRLASGPARVERLRPDLWLVDLTLTNTGMVPTLGGASRRPGIASVSMQVTGARLVSSARRSSDDEPYEAFVQTISGSEEAIVAVGHLDGLGRLGVRLVVEALEGAEISATFTCARAGVASTTATLR
jgi:hypothetical protein